MATRSITRAEAIALLRARCLALVDEEHSLCEVASRLHVLCGGFSQWRFHELRERYDWIVRRRPHVTRKELEDLANRWQLARQFVQGTELSCDTQTIEHHVCQGWDGFTDEQLATQFQRLLGEEVEIAPPVPAGAAAE